MLGMMRYYMNICWLWWGIIWTYVDYDEVLYEHMLAMMRYYMNICWLWWGIIWTYVDYDEILYEHMLAMMKTELHNMNCLWILWGLCITLQEHEWTAWLLKAILGLTLIIIQRTPHKNITEQLNILRVSLYSKTHSAIILKKGEKMNRQIHLHVYDLEGTSRWDLASLMVWC